MIRVFKPAHFAIAVVVLYAIAIAPALLRHRLDPSIFIFAGDVFVDPSKTPTPIYVRPNSGGYDGQFYYRIALAPFDYTQPLYGVTIDAPAYRMQRIGYPFLAWGLSLGQAQFVPLALLLLNLVGIAATAALAMRLTIRLALPPLVPLAIVLWPGFPITLTHDTTEILAATFVLAMLDRYFAGRMLGFVVFGVMATLTREISVLVLGGLFLYELMSRNLQRAAACGLAVLPFLAWRQLQTIIWGTVPSSAAMDVLGWPLVGIVQSLGLILFGPYGSRTGVEAIALRAYAFVSMVFLMAFSVLTASRFANAQKALVAAWLPFIALMAVLTANGPWIAPGGYLRAFTECWIVGCLLLDDRFAQSRLATPALAVLAILWVGAASMVTISIG